ncbi:MAG: serine-rich protein, partial [Anaerolineae bacterium]
MLGKRNTPTTTPPDSLDDLIVLDNGLEMVEGQDELDYLWFEIVEREAGREYHHFKVVRLAMLRYLPQEARHDAGLVAKQQAALVGLYNSQARFDLVHLVAGVFDPAIGIIQCYGVAASEPTLEEARIQADLGMAALQAVLANYAQARFVPLDIQTSAWLMTALAEMGHALVVIGHPDPRENARGGGRESPEERPGGSGKGNGKPGATYSQQQNELLFRGMAAQEEEFVWSLIAHRVDQASIAQMLAGIAAEASTWASRVSGTKGISFGLSVPIVLSGGLGRSAGTGYGENEGRSAGQAVNETEGQAHTEGHAESEGYAHTEGTSHTTGIAHSSGGSAGVTRTSTWSVSEGEGTTKGTADTKGTSESWGTAHTSGHSSTSGGSSSHSTTVSHTPEITTQSGSVTDVPEITAQGQTDVPDVVNYGSNRIPQVTTQSATHNPAHATVNAGSQAGQQAGVGAAGIIVGVSQGQSSGAAIAQGYDVAGEATTPAHSTASMGLTPAHQVESENTTPAHQVTSGSWSTTPAHDTVTTSTGGSSFHSSTNSSATTRSHSRGQFQSHTDSESQSQSTGRSEGGSVSRSASSFSSTTHSESWGEMTSDTYSRSTTESEADTLSHSAGRSALTGTSFSTVVGRSLAATRSMGISGGVIPSVTASKTYQWVDDAAAQVARLLRTQEEMLRQASLEGAYLTDVYVLTRSAQGRAAAEALVRQAFCGVEDVVTAVTTRRLDQVEQDYVRRHASAWTPSTRVETVPGLLEGYKDTTFLTMPQLAAYTAPGLFERGTAVTTQERIPPFAFLPDMKGQVVLAHLFDTETGRLTKAQVRLAQDRHMHTAFVGDTGSGKTVAAERLCFETALRWRHRNIVLDFGAGWRRLFDAPIPPESGGKARVDVWQLYPGAVRPLRWNPLQIGRRIPPDRQLRATAELFANAGQMGPRQLGFMRRALREAYLARGVLTSDRKVLSDAAWGRVQGGEEAAINAYRREKGLPARSAPAGTDLRDLEAIDRQALAIHRSRQVDMGDWYELLAGYKAELQRQRDAPSLTSLEGVLLRLDAFVQGEMGLMYGKGDDTIAIEDLGLLGPADDRWGIAILEGGAEMDEYAKATLLGLIAWHLYNDAIVRRREAVGNSGNQLPTMNIFWEEANKVLGGIAAGPTGGRDDAAASGRNQTSALFQAMWRDGRKYGVYNHVILQTASEIAPGILSSSNNIFVGQTKAVRDRD